MSLVYQGHGHAKDRVRCCRILECMTFEMQDLRGKADFEACKVQEYEAGQR